MILTPLIFLKLSNRTVLRPDPALVHWWSRALSSAGFRMARAIATRWCRISRINLAHCCKAKMWPTPSTTSCLNRRMFISAISWCDPRGRIIRDWRRTARNQSRLTLLIPIFRYIFTEDFLMRYHAKHRVTDNDLFTKSEA